MKVRTSVKKFVSIARLFAEKHHSRDLHQP